MLTVLCKFGLALLATLMIAPVATAQTSGAIDVRIDGNFAVGGRSVMISILQSGKLVKQSERTVAVQNDRYDQYHFGDLTPGRYDVRFEGEGMQTVIKQGISVLPKETTALAQRMQAGSGIKTITYSDPGLLEKLIERIDKLEAALKDPQRPRP